MTDETSNDTGRNQGAKAVLGLEPLRTRIQLHRRRVVGPFAELYGNGTVLRHVE